MRRISCIRMRTQNFQARDVGSIPSTRFSSDTQANSRELGSESAAQQPDLPTVLPTHDERKTPTWPLVIAAVFIAAIVSSAVFTTESDAATAKLFCQRTTLTPHQAINCTWPLRLRPAAKRVAECESTASAREHVARRRGLGRWARNGQYVGVFQMGPAERRKHGRYGVGSPAIAQTRSAYRLYHERGWQPWSGGPCA